MALEHIDWSKDEDWDAVAMSHAHRLHHIHIDRYGGYICRECSRDRLYVLRDDEVQRLLLMDRPRTEPQSDAQKASA